MSYGIRVQCVRNSHLRKGPADLAWTLGPVALQMYAKLGGIPLKRKILFDLDLCKHWLEVSL
jgi:hypothetical protein